MNRENEVGPNWVVAFVRPETVGELEDELKALGCGKLTLSSVVRMDERPRRRLRYRAATVLPGTPLVRVEFACDDAQASGVVQAVRALGPTAGQDAPEHSVVVLRAESATGPERQRLQSTQTVSARTR